MWSSFMFHFSFILVLLISQTLRFVTVTVLYALLTSKKAFCIVVQTLVRKGFHLFLPPNITFKLIPAVSPSVASSSSGDLAGLAGDSVSTEE